MSTRHIKQIALAAITAMAMSASAFAQDDQRKRGRDRGAASEAATEAFGFTEEQMDKIREIRRERPPRGQSGEERQAWRAEQQAKVEAVLTDEQKAKIADLNEMREKMRTLPSLPEWAWSMAGAAAAIQPGRGVPAAAIALERVAVARGRAEDEAPTADAARIAVQGRTVAVAGLAEAAGPRMSARSSLKRGERAPPTARSRAKRSIPINRSVLQGGPSQGSPFLSLPAEVLGLG